MAGVVLDQGAGRGVKAQEHSVCLAEAATHAERAHTEPWTPNKRATVSAKSERPSPGRGLTEEVTSELGFED